MRTARAMLKTKISISILLCGILVFWCFHATGAEWTDEQKEVWQAVEADTELFKKGDVEAIMADRHVDAIIWWGNKGLPFDWKLAKLNYKGWFKYDIPANWELEPLAIKVLGNVAIVAYKYKFSGGKSSGTGRLMMTFIKQNNKWLLMSSFGASCDELPPCE